MSIELFLAFFVPLAVADWWMDKVQRTTQLICRANNLPMNPVGQFLNPQFVRFAFPITIAKWGVAAYFAWTYSVWLAIAALVAAWAVTVVSPLPASLILPSISKQIARVRAVDAELGEKLGQMVSVWVDVGAKH